MRSQPSRRRLVLPIAGAGLVVLLGGLLGGCLTGRDRLAFRDVGHFYTPLYGYLAERERAQWLPLHNPLDELGMPLIGESTTALFYPPRRLIFWAWRTPETALAWYACLHLLLAGAAAGYAAKRAGAGRLGCGLATLAFPLSGPILFLYCNPPYLVGAAWLPLALAGGLGLARQWSFRDASLTAISLAMMILGGDPQTAVHVVLIGSGVVTVQLAWRGAASGLAMGGRLAAGLLLALALSLPQSVGTLDWASHSNRYASTATATADTYDFSVAPWHWVETILPSAWGHLFPTHTRISRAFAADGRTWTPTLYAGLLPLALALLSYHRRLRRKGPGWDTWDSLLPLAVLGSLGSFGVGHLAGQLGAFGPDGGGWLSSFAASPATLGTPDRNAVGGLWWWLATFFPGYSGFRYPAKWLIFAPLGIAIAAARQADRLTRPNLRRLVKTLTGLVTIATGLAFGIVIASGQRLAWFRFPTPAADSIWGPFDSAQANSVVAGSLLSVGLVACLMIAWLRWATNRRFRYATLGCGLTVLLLVDLAMVARPLLATIDRNLETAWLAELTADDVAIGSANRTTEDGTPTLANGSPPRVVRMSPEGWPAAWRETPSPGWERMLGAEVSQRVTHFGRWHLPDHTAVFNPIRSLPSRRVVTFWQAANREAEGKTGQQRRAYWDRLFAWLAISRVVQEPTPADERTGQHRPDGFLPLSAAAAERAELRTWVHGFRQREITAAQPHFTWHANWRETSPQSAVTIETFSRRIRELTGESEDADLPWVEKKQSNAGRDRSSPPSAVADASATLRLLDAPADGWRIRVTADQAGLLCWRGFQDGNLQAIARPLNAGTLGAPQRLAVERCDFLFAAIELPAGDHEVLLRYRPSWLTPGLAIWGLAWLGLITTACTRYCRSAAAPM